MLAVHTLGVANSGCYACSCMLQAIYKLLVTKPEGEAKLLAALVNKLGDPNRKIASKAGYLLSQLLLQHPVMKPIVAREVRAVSGQQAFGRRASWVVALLACSQA